MEFRFLDDGETEAPFCEHCFHWIGEDEEGCLNIECQEIERARKEQECLEEIGDDRRNERQNP